MGRMTENMKSEAVRLYFEENREPDDIARQIGASERQVKTILGDLKRLEAYRKKSEAAKLRAQICVYESAEEAARHQAALLSQSEGNDNIRQRAAKDILDRAGVGLDRRCVGLADDVGICRRARPRGRRKFDLSQYEHRQQQTRHVCSFSAGSVVDVRGASFRMEGL